MLAGLKGVGEKAPQRLTCTALSDAFKQVWVVSFALIWFSDPQDGQSRTIRQFQFTDWPEQGVPKTGEGFIDFIGQVHKTKEQFGQDGPITVHCRYTQPQRAQIQSQNQTRPAAFQ